MRLQATVLTYREQILLRRAVDSVAALESVEIVNNGAREEDIEAVRDQFPNLKSIHERENKPFSVVVNDAVARAAVSGAEALLFLTNDAAFEPGAVELLVERLESVPTLAAVMPLQIRANDPSTIHHAGGGFDRFRWSAEILLGGEPLSCLQEAAPVEVDWVDGAAVLYRVKACQAIGPLWPGFGFYWEDVDWGLRAKAAGWSLEAHRGARAVHELSPTTGKFEAWRHYLMARNRLLCARRNLGRAAYGRVRSKLLVSSFALAVRSPHRVQQRMRLAAVIDVAMGRTDNPPGPHGFRWSLAHGARTVQDSG